jgi:hypothetical protein
MRCLVRRRFVFAPLLLIVLAVTVQAELVIEPVFNRVAGTGGAENVVGVRQAVNGIQTELGIQPAWQAQPGEVFSYVSGDPRKIELDNFFFYNDTDYDITGFSLEIIGTGTDTDDPRTIVRGAPIDARFGDVDGDRQILSNIFSSHQISANGKSIQFSGGLIRQGERFTDIHLARSDNPPELAGLDTSFSGILVPEPSSAILLLAALFPLLQRRQLRETDELPCRGV